MHDDAADLSFASLYAEHGVLLRAMAMQDFRVPPDDAAALVHDAFITYLQRQTTASNARGWLLGTVRNACRHYWRDHPEASPESPAEPSDAAADRNATLWRMTVARAVAGLDPRCRDLLRRYYARGESATDIAASLSTSRESVWQVLSQCRQRIGEAIGEAGDSAAGLE